MADKHDETVLEMSFYSEVGVDVNASQDFALSVRASRTKSPPEEEHAVGSWCCLTRTTYLGVLYGQNQGLF